MFDCAFASSVNKSAAFNGQFKPVPGRQAQVGRGSARTRVVSVYVSLFSVSFSSSYSSSASYSSSSLSSSFVLG
jgi:hypothetical protein